MRQWLSSLRALIDVHLIDLGDSAVTIGTLISVTLIIAATLLIARVVERAVSRALRGGRITDARRGTSLVRLIHYAILVLGLTVAVDALGIDLRALFAAGAIFALAISFGLQNFIQNFVAGIILLTEQTISPDDVLHVQDRMVKVVRLGLRSTVVRTRDEEEIILPNSILVQDSVTNYTLSDDLYRLRTQVGVSYASDLHQVWEVLMEAARAIEDRSPDVDPVVLVRSFGDSSIEMDVSVWIREPWNARATRSWLNLKIWEALREAGITIAFPQLDVHLDEPTVAALGGGSRGTARTGKKKA